MINNKSNNNNETLKKKEREREREKKLRVRSIFFHELFYILLLQKKCSLPVVLYV
jgi:hypothetical protein